MKTLPSPRRGSVLMTVIFFAAIMALLTGSILTYTISERRSNERQRVVLRTRNMAENISVYAAEQLTTKLMRLRSAQPMAFIGGENQIHLPPSDVLTQAPFSKAEDMEVYAGLTATSGLALVTDTTNPNYGLSVSTSTVPIISKATMSHPSAGSYTSYTQHDMEVAMIPLFQFGLFYNMDLEFFPGQTMTIAGPVHTNGRLMARGEAGGTAALTFTDRVTAAEGLYAHGQMKANYRTRSGSNPTDPGGTGAVYYTSISGTQVNLQGAHSGSTKWRDHKMGGSTETATTQNQFKTFATSTYGGNVRTNVHGVTKLELPSIGTYKEDGTIEERNNGRQIVAAPASGDPVGVKISRQAGLYIVVNPDDTTRTGKKPDGTDLTMLPRSYRSFLNRINSDGSQTVTEIILPGQPSYGYSNNGTPADATDDFMFPNNLPNRYRVDTAIGSNQVLRIPQGDVSGGLAWDFAGTGYAGPTAPTFPSLTDAYFYDLRRANNNSGYPYSRASANYTPRPIAKIDFDLTRFKMMIERTLWANVSSTIYYPSRPVDSTTWNASIFNASAAPAGFGLGTGASFADFPAREEVIYIAKSERGALLPSTLEFTANSQAGTGSTAAYPGRFTIEADSGSGYSTIYTSASDEASCTLTPVNTVLRYRVRLFLAGGTSTKVDEQIIPVVADPTDETVTEIVAVQSNPFHVVPSLAGGASPLVSPTVYCENEIRIFVNGVDDTANWTLSAATTNCSGSFNTGRHANRYRVTGITANTGTVTITATRSGYTNQTLTMSLTKQSSAGAGTDQTGRWFSVGGMRHPDPFRIYLAPSDPNHADVTDSPASFALSSGSLYSAGSTSPWFDGVAIYVHSVGAETRAQTSGVPDRLDSGVRLWNGRGALVSLTDANKTGFTFATNDAAYLVGHFNADGTINSNANSAGYGGYSARYADSSNEKLAAVMADSITILSQPTFTSSSGNYYQTSGWNDAFSAHGVNTDSSYSTSWRTANPSSSNQYDGINTSQKPAALPNLSTPGPLGSNAAEKLPTVNTEISAALLMGLIPSNHNPTGLTDGPPSSGANQQYSGGAHNFPRLLESWNGIGLYIRGSMVALFESRVAMEPWNLRVYTAPNRYWGLHQELRNANHDVPLEPIVLNARRMSYREITAADYETMKETILDLPH